MQISAAGRAGIGSPSWATRFRSKSRIDGGPFSSGQHRRPVAADGPCLLCLVVVFDADRLVVVGRIEFGAIATPGGALQDAIDLAKPGCRKP